MEFQCNEDEFMTLSEFYEVYQERLPTLLYVVEGNCGKTIYDEISTGEVLCVHTSASQRRVLAQINNGKHPTSQYLSLPLDTPYRLVQEDHDVSKACSLQQIIEDNTFPISVKFAPDVGTFKVGQTVGNTRMYNRLKLLKEYNETFLCYNNVEESGEIRQEVSQLALSKDITVAIVTGIANRSAETFQEFLSTIGQNLAETDVRVNIGNPHIASVTTEGTGSGNPLPQFMLNLFQGKDNSVSINTLHDPSDLPNDKKQNETDSIDLHIYGNVESQQDQILEAVESNVNTEYSRVIKHPNTSGDRNLDCEIYDDIVTPSYDLENTRFLGPINEIEVRYSDECSINELEQIESSENSLSSSTETVMKPSVFPSSKRMGQKQDLNFANYNLPRQSLERLNNTASSQQIERLQECASGFYESPSESEISSNFIGGGNMDTFQSSSNETPSCSQTLLHPARQQIEKNSYFASGLYEDLDANLESTFVLPLDQQLIPTTQLPEQTETMENIKPSEALPTQQQTPPTLHPVRKPNPDTTNPDKLPKRRKPTLFASCVQGIEEREELVMSGFYEIPVNNNSDNLLNNGTQIEQSAQRESETYATVSEVTTDPQKSTTVTQPMSPPVKENKVRKNMFQVLEELVITVKRKKQENCPTDTNKSSKADTSRSIDVTKGDNPKHTKKKVVKNTSVRKRFRSFLQKKQNKEKPLCDQSPQTDTIGNVAEESLYMEMDFSNKTQNSIDIMTEISTTDSQSTYMEMKPSMSTANLHENDTDKKADAGEVKIPLSPFELSMYMCMGDIAEKISNNDKTQPMKQNTSQTSFEPCTYMEMSALDRRPQDIASGSKGADTFVYEDMNEVMKRK